jgi:hypothetical protein
MTEGVCHKISIIGNDAVKKWVAQESIATGPMIPTEKMNFSRKENEMELIRVVILDLWCSHE